MDRAAVLAAFDAQVRRDALPVPGTTVRRSARTTRVLADDGSWAAVVWSDLTGADADRVIAEELRATAGTDLEWKHYGHDRPADLPDRLRAAGLGAEPAETLLVADLAGLDLPVQVPDGVRLVTVDGEDGIAAMLAVHRQAFDGGEVHPGTAASVRASLALSPRPVEAVVAVTDDGRPVAAGRVEFTAGDGFAGLYGGGTVPDQRGRGLFRALVAHRAAGARARGVRHLYVDAVPASRPILERLGFVPLAVVTAWTRAPGGDPDGR